jgi:hypothetical protein
MFKVLRRKRKSSFILEETTALNIKKKIFILRKNTERMEAVEAVMPMYLEQNMQKQ